MTATVTILDSAILSNVKRMASLVGATTFNKDNLALYDNIAIKSRESALINQYLEDAGNVLVSRFADIATFGTGVVTLTAPDGISSFSERITLEMQEFIAYYAAARWFADRHPEIQAEYDARATAAANKISEMVYQRAMPTRTTSTTE